MAKWTEIEFGDALAMATNPVYPGRKAAKSLLNVHTHQRPGAMTLRPGYELKYEEPVNGRITNPSVLNFDFFFDRQAEPQGREITVLLQKGTLISLDGSDVSDTQNMLCVWARPYWNGMTWVDEWQWLNETIITKIVTASDSTYKNVIEIYDGLTIADDSLIGYSIHNKTRGQTAKIITNKIVIPGTTRINHTLFDSDWEADDVIVISKSWLEPEVLEALFNVSWEDITFHRVLNDLRIGFGGYENRLGLAVGYRENYYRISETIDFSDIHSDITSNALIEFSKVNGLVLETTALNPNNYGIEITAESGSLNADKYYLRLTGVIDNFQEQLIAENFYETDGSENLLIRLFIKLGDDSSRITKYKLYFSSDNITYNLIREDQIRQNKQEFGELSLESDGKLYTLGLGLASGEYHKDANAASVDNEINSLGSWIREDNSFGGLVPAATTTLGAITILPEDGSYYIRYFYNESVFKVMKIFSPWIGGLGGIKKLKVSFYARAIYENGAINSSYGLIVSSAPGVNQPSNPDYVVVGVNRDWKHFEFELEMYGRLSFSLGEVIRTNLFIDGLSVIPISDELILGTEMSDEMGYNPTFNMVRGWDQALLFRGRAYYLNPFIEKRYENFIVVSHIAPPSTYMYDMASFSNFRELEKFDSNKAIAMALLPTIELLILKDKSINAIDPDTGASREPVFGIGCVSRNTVVNMNGIIYWADEDDIYVMNIGGGFTPRPILEETIRDIYQALTNKEWLFAIRDRYNTYRLRTYDEANKREFLFTKNGPIEENKYLYPEIYRIGAGGILNFLSKGNIYRLDPELAGVITDDLGEYLVDDEETYITDK